MQTKIRTKYATRGDFSKANLLAMSQACYVAGGEPSVILVGPVQARKDTHSRTRSLPLIRKQTFFHFFQLFSHIALCGVK